MKRNWKIFYASYEGPEKRAVDLIYKEVGNYFLRDVGVYSYHTIGCENVGEVCEENAIVLGTYAKNKILQKHIRKDEVPADGYVVKVMNNPEYPEYKLVLICGDTPAAVFYGTVDFLDDYLAKATPSFDAYIHLPNELFQHPLPDYYIATSPDFKTRSVFTWGHPIDDYQEYIANLARLKLNQVIIWNDYLPLNSEDIVAYAHSYGMEVIWGYAWGWGFNCMETNVNNLDELKQQIVDEFNRTYRNVGGDGIYFQSFTELPVSHINGVKISEAVVDLVNQTASVLLEDNPNLHIQFGLHASSVRNSLEDIARVDKRIEIVWEDCGGFPYKSWPDEFNGFHSLEQFESQYDFADKIIELRGNGQTGIVYKGMLTMDWSRGRVTHQVGPYVMGKVSDAIKQSDDNLISKAWRVFSAEWMEDGKYVHDLTRHIKEKTDGNVNMCMAGMFSGGVWFPTALCAELYWDSSASYEDIRKKVLKRNWVRV